MKVCMLNLFNIEEKCNNLLSIMKPGFLEGYLTLLLLHVPHVCLCLSNECHESQSNSNVLKNYFFPRKSDESHL